MDVIHTEDRCPYNVPGRRAEQEQRSINGTTINAAKTVNPRASAAADGRKLQQASEEAVSTASYEQYSGTYHMGQAEVFWGTFYATNQATGERWEEDGTFQWVVDTENTQGSGTGTPPEGRYELEPNSVRFVFSKKREVNTYADSKASTGPSEVVKERNSYSDQDSNAYKEPTEGCKERTSYGYEGADSKPYRKQADRYRPRYEPSKERSSYGYEEPPRQSKHYRLSTSQQQEDNMNA